MSNWNYWMWQRTPLSEIHWRCLQKQTRWTQREECKTSSCLPSCKLNPTQIGVLFVSLKKYIGCSDSPAEVYSLYLIPPKQQQPTATCWLSLKPSGHNTLSKTIACLSKAAGISGFKTNHSLRATAASSLYQHGTRQTTRNGKNWTLKHGRSEEL